MSESRAFIHPGQPFPKERPRARVLSNGRATIYTPSKTKAAELALCGSYTASHLGKPPMKGDLRLGLVFWRETRRRADLDNLIKLVWDSLNGVAYRDDSQIVEVSARVIYGAQLPATDVVIQQVEREG